MVQDEGSFPLLVQDWGAIEEVLLLDAVEQDGFGNWWVFQLCVCVCNIHDCHLAIGRTLLHMW